MFGFSEGVITSPRSHYISTIVRYTQCDVMHIIIIIYWRFLYTLQDQQIKVKQINKFITYKHVTSSRPRYQTFVSVTLQVTDTTFWYQGDELVTFTVLVIYTNDNIVVISCSSCTSSFIDSRLDVALVHVYPHYLTVNLRLRLQLQHTSNLVLSQRCM